jgi:hypothetical protein
MRPRLRFPTLALALAAACGSNPPTTKKAGPSTTEVTTNGDGVAVATTTAVKPKALSQTIEKGLAWLAKQQLKSGGWGQGDESQHMGNAMASQRDRANVADTSMALLAFLRAGQSGRAGEHQATVQRGVDYVLAEIEESDDASLRVTKVTGTRVQGKIGQYADTFAALMMLTEAQGKMRDGVANARVDAAIKKVVKKIEKNQRDNGSWDDQGWAPVLSQALAAKGLNRAAQNGMQVSQVVLERVEKQAQSSYNASAGSFADAGGAGIEIYSAAASTAGSRDSAATKKVRVEQMKAKAAAAAKERQSPGVPTKAQIDRAEKDAQIASDAAAATEAALVARLDDQRFVAGFGNNGGEEFLSYLLISETLVQKGGSEWARWDSAITNLVAGVQNEDGSWTGHHCITGRTFCTAAALLVLMGDRTPAAVVIAS